MLDLVERSSGVCGSRWQARRVLRDLGVSLEYRNGDPDRLDAIRVDNYENLSAKVSTREGVGVGTTENDLLQTYGNRLKHGTFIGEGGDYFAYAVFGPDGALAFVMGDESPRTVTGMSAVAGTSMATLDMSPGGC